MKCDLCDKQATVFLTEIVDGKIQKVNLCQECSQQNQGGDPAGAAMADFLLGMGQSGQGGEGGAEVACPSCGMELSDFKKTGRLGCCDCYETFGRELESVLENTQHGSRHLGKSPGHLPDISVGSSHSPAKAKLQQPEESHAEQASAGRVSELKEKLAKAIETECYEDAARLRDEIRDIQNGSSEDSVNAQQPSNANITHDDH